MATTPNSLTPLLKKINLPWLLATLGTGAGIMAIVSRLAANEPKAVIDLVGNWGPLFALALFLIWVGDRRTGEMLAVSRESALSQQKLADAMQQIAQKDDIRGREMELGMATMGRNMERLLQHMVEMRNEIVSLRKPGAGN